MASKEDVLHKIKNPADWSTRITQEKSRHGSEMVRHTFKWRWGAKTEANRVEVLINTIQPLYRTGNSVVVPFDPRTCSIHVGGDLLLDRSIGAGLHYFCHPIHNLNIVWGLGAELYSDYRPVVRTPYHPTLM